MPKKRGAKRRATKWPGLNPGVNARTRREVIDFDYINKLSPKEKDFLSNFMEEWVGGNFYHEGKVLHKSVQSKRDCYNRNNARNRDALSVSGATGFKTDLTPLEHAKFESPEDTLNALIDLQDANITPEMIEHVLHDEKAFKNNPGKPGKALKQHRKKLRKGSKRRKSR